MNFLEKLIGGALKTAIASAGAKKAAPAAPSPADGRQLLGVSTQAPGSGGALTPVYAPINTPTPSVALPESNLQRYGDAQGNQWLENAQGQRFAIQPTPQATDAPWAGGQHQALRPGVTGYLPVGDATVHTPAPPTLRLRSS